MQDGISALSTAPSIEIVQVAEEEPGSNGKANLRHLLHKRFSSRGWLLPAYVCAQAAGCRHWPPEGIRENDPQERESSGVEGTATR